MQNTFFARYTAYINIFIEGYFQMIILKCLLARWRVIRPIKPTERVFLRNCLWWSDIAVQKNRWNSMRRICHWNSRYWQYKFKLFIGDVFIDVWYYERICRYRAYTPLVGIVLTSPAILVSIGVNGIQHLHYRKIGSCWIWTYIDNKVLVIIPMIMNNGKMWITISFSLVSKFDEL